MLNWREADFTSYTSTVALSAEEEEQRQKEAMQTARKLVEELGKQLGHKPTCCVVTFGCQMNARDSEKILGILMDAGYQESDSEEADFVIYNTCTVRDNANQRVYGRLGHLNSMKKKNPQKRIALCGCMIQEPDVIEKIRTSYRFVDLLFGTHNLYKFPELLCTMLQNDRMVIDVWKATDAIVEDLPVVRKYPFKSGVNIMFGCDNYCTYCIVPYVRGRERSRSSKEILQEVERLAKDGVVEVMLLGQNVNSYGNGIEGEISFPELLKEVEQVEGIRRIRFMTSHPKDLSDELIAVMRDSKKICRHLHLPVQSGSSEVLRKMNRRYTREQYLELVAKLRREIPDLSITTDIIVGFPGETKEDLEQTITLVKEVGYDNAFTFIYSPRTGTPAASYEKTMSDDEISQGFERLLTVVQDKARESVSRLHGRVEEALVEEVNSHDATLVTGRLSNNVLVHFPGDASMIGKFYPVKLTENRGFYYIGEMV